MRFACNDCASKNSRLAETSQVRMSPQEKTIIKIGSLLALGFGEAGAEVIGQNMQGGERPCHVNCQR